MRIIRKMLRQNAIFWECTGADSQGQPVFADAVEIKCRWEESSESFLDFQGNQRISNAIVFVDRDIPHRSRLWLGTMDQLGSQTVPPENIGASEVQRFRKIPTLKADNFLRMAYL